MEKLGTLESEVLSHEVVDGRVKVVIRTVPGMKLPRIVRPILRGKEVEFVDTRTFAEGSKHVLPFTQTFQTVNNITDRAVVTGTITIDEVRDGGAAPRCALYVEGECVVKIAGLGSKVESIIVENLKNAYRRLPLIIDEWMSVRHLHVANMSPIPVRSPMSGRPPAPASSPLQSQHSSGSFGSFHSADSELDSPPGSDAEAQSDPPAAASAPAPGKQNTPADAFGGFFATPGARGSRDGDVGGSGLTPHAFEPDTPENTPMLVRHAYRHADDLDSADEGDGVGGGGVLGGTRARRGGGSARSKRRRGKAGTGCLSACFRRWFFCFGRGAPLLSDDDDEDEDEDASTPGSEEDAAAAAAAEEEDGMNPWEDPRAAEDSLRTPLSPGLRKNRARR